jgi:hypothetical protein
MDKYIWIGALKKGEKEEGRWKGGKREEVIK